MSFLSGEGKRDGPAEAPVGPSSDEFKGLQPGVYRAREEAEESAPLFLILQRDPDNGRKAYRCEGAHEAQTFLETLIADGVDREDIELFRASRIPFSLSFRPVVDFEA